MAYIYIHLQCSGKLFISVISEPLIPSFLLAFPPGTDVSVMSGVGARSIVSEAS